jgi:DNA gyrase subunit B
MAKTSTYGASNIQVLEGLEAVRKRPAMYIGSTDKMGLHHIFTEILDNAVDEAIAEFCDHIWVTLNKDGSCTVEDNGRGIPIEDHPQTKVSTLETVMTNLHAGGKFDQGAYKVSGGLHGVGMKCTNALSEWMETIVCKDGGKYKQEYKRGIPQYPVKKIGKCNKNETGTKHTFKPDPEIFEEVDWDFRTVLKKCRQHAYLTAGLWFTITDNRVEEDEEPKIFELYFEDGIKSYVQFLNLDEKILSEEPFYMNKEDQEVLVEVALQYTDGMDETVMCYTNNIINPEGGTHLAGFRMALTGAVNAYAQENEMLKGVKGTLSGDDVREGLTAVVSVKVTDPQFEGQTKIKLNNREVRGIVTSLLRDELLTYFNENPDIAKKIIGKAVVAHRAKVAAKAARDAVVRKSALESSTLPGKLADCISNDPADCELYVVEGDSAGGCFSGDTKIALTDGRSLSFVELIKEQEKGIKNYCYTIGRDNRIEIGEIKNVRRTKKNTAVVKVTLDNDEEIRCTPDHKFMLRDGDYKEAKDLQKSDSLMQRKDYNHKIKSVEYLDEKIDVYDLEVPKTHNFALASGIFVHNSAKQGRDRHTQAVLPLRGKILNTHKYRVDRVLNNKEFNDITTALGVGIGDSLDIKKLRYHKVIIMSDADVDGLHITTLVLTLLFRFFRPLIEEGYVYVAQPPLFKVEIGKQRYYFINDKEKEKFVKKAKSSGKNPVVNRFKGLGEMDPEQLWETTMNPETRVLKRVKIEDAQEAEHTFEMLMGTEVPPRRRFIQKHANQAILDV